ncbi:uncharacterized protein LOC105837089 isoform X2 [Monomorium pharaonis]|uniref:uncharacterized protein LOC105837089 isoform X2 n=1 Tax=Monomorium pharaonis TaxID=307658 RepID=UPI00063F3803|nr:uncharacterized protein LOC105837089 isoform X2 [Monomorium pharaonis]
MSTNNSEGNYNLFEDYYKNDNFDDSELQSRLYAEIYYESNIENESGTANAPRTIQYDNMAIEMNVELEGLQHKSKKQSSDIQDSQKTQSMSQTDFAEVNTCGKEMISVTCSCDNQSPDKSLVSQGKRNKTNSSKKFKSPKHVRNKQKSFAEDNNDMTYSKYNVVSKSIKQKRLFAKQIDGDNDSSDSEDSVLEVPIPPKPVPPLIDLQDSDEENHSNSATNEDDLILKNWKNNTLKTYSKHLKNMSSNHELEISETSSDHQNISFTDKNIENNKDPNRSIQTSTCTQEIMEDIVLNCTTIQKGAKSISEIKQLSKSTRVDEESQSTRDTNQNSKSRSPQSKSKENNKNDRQEMSVSSGRKSQMRAQQNNDTVLRMEPCSPIIDRKRQCSDKVNSQPKQKRQCIVQQNGQDVTLQGTNGEKRNASSNEFCNQKMSEEMRNFYNLSRGQENFDVAELQQHMSKDPRKWAILDEDIMPCPSNRQRTRFWNSKCSNCHQEGHRRYDCPILCAIACCYMCGKKGHTAFQCPEKMCLTCGHAPEQCPDLWRRYHQTTDMSNTPQDPGNVIKPARLLYCCNCVKRGHESSTCRRYRWSEYFPTPSDVTNYTDGPTYSSFSRPDPESDFSSLKTRENETSIPQNVTDIQLAIERAMIEDVEPSTNVDMSSLNTNVCVPSTSQVTAVISQVEENSPMAHNILSILNANLQKEQHQTVVGDINFIEIIHSYGTFYNKNHNNARMILKNLNLFYQNRNQMLNNLRIRKLVPDFLKALLEKSIQFEVKIGFIQQRRFLFLQILAMKEYIEFLYDLLRYWLNLPDDEKDYGLDVFLPIHTMKMYNLLITRMPQLKKMRFTCYADYIGGENDPRYIYDCIKEKKAKLNHCKGSKKKYINVRRNLWRLQIQLLMIVNTEPEPNSLVKTFPKMMETFKLQRNLMGEKLDTATYLGLILLYNKLFVPHTAFATNQTLKHFAMEEKKMKKSKQVQQELGTKIDEQGNFMYDAYSSSTESYNPQNIELESFSVINNQQNKEILVEGQSEDNTTDTSQTTNHIYNGITITRNFTQDDQIMPLNIEPIPIQLEDPRKNQDYVLTNEVNVKSNISAPFVSMNNKNKNENMILNKMVQGVERAFLTKEEKKKLRKKCKLQNITPNDMYSTASTLVKKARAFNVPHMLHAAKEMEKRINNQKIQQNHIQTLFRMISQEDKHQKSIKASYGFWKNIGKNNSS